MKYTVEEDLQCLEIGPIVHSRLLTLACRILRYYTSRDVAAAPQTPQLGGAQANFGGPS